MDLADSDDEDCPFTPLEDPVTTETRDAPAECLFTGWSVGMLSLIEFQTHKLCVCVFLYMHVGDAVRFSKALSLLIFTTFFFLKLGLSMQKTSGKDHLLIAPLSIFFVRLPAVSWRVWKHT